MKKYAAAEATVAQFNAHIALALNWQTHFLGVLLTLLQDTAKLSATLMPRFSQS